MTADTLVPQAGDPQAFNRYAYVRNNPIVLNDPTGHCWGAFSGVRQYSAIRTLCENTDSAFEIMTSPDASVAQRAVGAAYLLVEGAAAVAGTTGAVILGGHVVYGATTAAMPYAYAAGAAVETTIASAEAAAPVTTAVVRGLAETAVECQFAGNCNWTDYAWGAATAGMATVGAKRAGCDRSFDEDTLVTTEEGLVPISEIEEGDYVLAYNEETGEVSYYPVTETWVHEDPVLTYLVIEGEFIATTPTHLFYTTEGWVEAGELGEDAYVVRASGAPGQVWESLTFTLPRQMYDLTVAEMHTFFVGEEQWLVHNCGTTTRPSGYRSGVRPTVENTAPVNDAGDMICMGCGNVMTRATMDHYPPVWQRRQERTYNTRAEFLDDYNNVTELRPLCLSCNRGHGFETTPTDELPYYPGE